MLAIGNSISGEAAIVEDLRGTVSSENYKNVAALYDNFMNLAKLCTDISMVYRNRPIWCQYPSDSLIRDPRDIYKRIPTSRAAVHNYIGLLVHESAHQHFVQRESGGGTTNYKSVEDASISLIDMVENHLLAKWNQLSTLEVLGWACNLACELHINNHRRPCAVQMQAHVKAEQFLVLLKQSKSVSRLLQLINGIIELLLKKSPDECLNLLFDVSRYGADFNWMWLHISDKFPEMIVSRLFEIGQQSFREYVKIHEDNARTPMGVSIFKQVCEDWQTKIQSFSYLFTFLTFKKHSQLKDAFSSLIEKGFSTDAPLFGHTSSCAGSLSLLFVFRVVIDSPPLINYVVTHNVKYMSPSYFILLAHHAFSLPRGCLSSNFVADMDQLSGHLDLESTGMMMENILRTAFDPYTFSGFDTTSDSSVPVMRDGALRVLSRCVDNLVRFVHKNQCVDGCKAFAIFSSGSKLQELVDWSLVHPHGRPPLLQYLHAISIAFGVQKGAEIVARFILRAKDEHELGVMLSFLTSIHPFFPNIMASVYEGFSVFRQHFYEEEKKKDINYRDSFSWINAIRILLIWETRAADKEICKSIGFYPGKKLGEVLTDILSRCIERMRNDVETGEKGDLAARLTDVTHFLDATGYSQQQAKELLASGVIVHCPVLSMSSLHKCAHQLATVLRFSLLLFVEGVSEKEANGVNEGLRTVINKFIHEELTPVQSTAFYKVFVSSFIHGLLQESRSLFNDPIDNTVYKLSPMDVVSPPSSSSNSSSLIEGIRSLTLKQSVASLAHSGQILPPKGKKRIVPMSDWEGLRLAVSMDILHSMIVSNQGCTSKEEALIAAKKIAWATLDAACIDGLGEDYAFGEWELEREAIARYVEISGRVDSSPLLQHLLVLLSECPPALWFTLPVLKASLATLISSFEKAVDRSKRPSDILLERADRWVTLARRGEVLPERLGYVMDMLPYVSCNEGFHLLLSTWKYFQRARLTYDVVNEMHGAAMRGDPQEAMPALEEFLESFICVAHANIAELGWVVPLIYPRLVDDALRHN
ncbi:hypothetical protein PMAYCL1PPCAC_29477 [Pristionchus mayeri]|uniref:Uncharacterized protein n=1 Tax=Pristionchus mayeri TaxID=1317129 RepID=A0AAN5DB19_9BILA|nr:hypothetical protein PMAYCL1PPCAC_29477 [Pristionchus mayeri]